MEEWCTGVFELWIVVRFPHSRGRCFAAQLATREWDVVGLKRKIFAHGFSRIGTDYWGECSGLFFLAIEPSSGLAIRQEDEERGSR